MFPTPAFDATPIVKFTGADGHARWHSRVRGLPETFGELPASILAEEMETPGDGQIRAMVTYAGNPVLSTPNGRRLSAALERLDFMVSVDLYVNETTRHAQVILPPAWSLCDDHVDLIFGGFAVRNTVRWSPPVLARPTEEKSDWQILLELIYRLGGGPMGVKGLDACCRLARRLGWRWKPDGTVDLLLRLGPYGDRFLPWSNGLNLKKLKRATHGIDLGPLVEGIAHRTLHKDGRMHLDVPVLLAGIDELAAALDAPAAVDDDTLLLIGRRELRSNNSWMHNISELVVGHARCVLLVHPDDARRRGIRDGQTAVLESRVHKSEVPVRYSDDVRPGVVSLPHGWGHAESARWQAVAGAHPGVSFNDWSDDAVVESVVGQSVLNGVRVKLAAKADAGDGQRQESRTAAAAPSGG
jgi:anaerobic selenocysteine-containing dehydrogenase